MRHGQKLEKHGQSAKNMRREYRRNVCVLSWLRGVDLNHRPLGYEPNELPDCSTPHFDSSSAITLGQTWAALEAEVPGLHKSGESSPD
jgi:hypothetical protein